MGVIPQLVWLAVPIVATGLVHFAVLTHDWLPALRRAPLDFGITVRGRRLFGANKTWRGAVVMVCGATAFAVLLAAVNAWFMHLPAPIEYAQTHPARWGALLGLGYILGELPNSFVKRQLDIAPGAMGHGPTGRLFWIVDQLDSLVGILLCVLPVWRPPLTIVAASVLVMLAAHPVSSWVMVRARLKDRIG